MSKETQSPSATPNQRQPLPTFRGTERDPNAPLNAGDLAEMIAALRPVAEKLRPCSGEQCDQLAAHERTLRFLNEELRKHAPQPEHGLNRAGELADIFQFEVPDSHRPQFGRTVTAAKRAMMRGLKPFNTELLRPQHAFNRELVEILKQVAIDRDRGLSPDTQSSVQSRLEALQEPRTWTVRSHRKKAAARVVGLAKRSYLITLSRLLKQVLSEQRF